MRIACIAERAISYSRRVLRGVVGYARYSPDLEIEIFSIQDAADQQIVQQGKHDGFIFTTWTKYASLAVKLGIPSVMLARDDPAMPVARVVADDYHIGQLAAEHLLLRGHRHLAYWGNDGDPYSVMRHNGFADTVVKSLGEQARPTKLDAAATNLAQLISELPKPLGLMTGQDQWGSVAIALCRKLGLRVPTDVAVIGVDDDDLYGGEMSIPPMSTVALLTDRIGYTGCQMLHRLLEGKNAPPLTLVPPGPVIARQSSQTRPIDDAIVVAAIEKMEQNIDRSITVKELLRSTGLQRKALELHFRKAINRTPGQELQRLKIERAKLLLATTNQQIQQIATMAGFANATRLNSAFRRATKMTAGEYRKQLTSLTNFA